MTQATRIEIHVCRGCGSLCENSEYCCCCREGLEDAARDHAERANQMFSGQPRETGVMPEDDSRDAQKKARARLTRIGVNVVLLAAWLYMAADLFQRSGH